MLVALKSLNLLIIVKAFILPNRVTLILVLLILNSYSLDLMTGLLETIVVDDKKTSDDKFYLHFSFKKPRGTAL